MSREHKSKILFENRATLIYWWIIIIPVFSGQIFGVCPFPDPEARRSSMMFPSKLPFPSGISQPHLSTAKGNTNIPHSIPMIFPRWNHQVSRWQNPPSPFYNKANVCPIEVAHLLYFEAAGICGMVVLVLLIAARHLERSPVICVFFNVVMKRNRHNMVTKHVTNNALNHPQVITIFRGISSKSGMVD